CQSHGRPPPGQSFMSRPGASPSVSILPQARLVIRGDRLIVWHTNDREEHRSLSRSALSPCWAAYLHWNPRDEARADTRHVLLVRGAMLAPKSFFLDEGMQPEDRRPDRGEEYPDRRPEHYRPSKAPQGIGEVAWVTDQIEHPTGAKRLGRV